MLIQINEKHADLIITALRDYRMWFEETDKGDKEQIKKIDKVIDDVNEAVYKSHKIREYPLTPDECFKKDNNEK